MRLSQTVALITGAARGLGRSIAVRFAAEGARLVLVDAEPEALEAVVRGLEPEGHGCIGVRADVTRPDKVEAAVGQAVERFGRLDCAVNNAGIMDRMQMVDEADVELYRRVMAVNAEGPFLVTRAALRRMLAQEPAGGSIVNIASLAGVGGMRGGAAYTMSKHAVIGLTRSVAFAYRHRGVRCNAVLPGSMATSMGESGSLPDISAQGMRLLGEGFQQPGTMIVVDTARVAATVAFLASDDARDVSGAEIAVDGGGAAY